MFGIKPKVSEDGVYDLKEINAYEEREGRRTYFLESVRVSNGRRVLILHQQGPEGKGFRIAGYVVQNKSGRKIIGIESGDREIVREDVKGYCSERKKPSPEFREFVDLEKCVENSS